jgi:hypothetical protein
MYLLLIVLWCAAVMRACRGHFPYSRFGVFNSRLGPNKFPFRPAREFARNGLNWLSFFCNKTAIGRNKSKNSRLNGNNREILFSLHGADRGQHALHRRTSLGGAR